MAFLLKLRELRNMTLCNNDLPWVHSGKHLGTRINNTPENMLGQDIREKRAQYIQCNNELMQARTSILSGRSTPKPRKISGGRFYNF